jgi:hypothetical protein
MWSHILLGAAVVGPFSGVDLDRLRDTPMLIEQVVFAAQAGELAKLGTGTKTETRDGEQVIVTQDGFAVEFEAELTAGTYRLSVQANAPGNGADSYWAVVDGEQVSAPLTLPINTMAERSLGIPVRETGRHQVRLMLREAPGSALKSVRLSRVTNSIPRPPMRPELAGKHPRIFFTADHLAAIRARLASDQVKQFYAVPGPLTRRPPPFRPGQRNGGEYRGLCNYAFGYLMKPDEKMLQSIIPWLEMATTYPHCGVDLDAEYFMEGLALTYDWLYDEIPAELRAGVRDAIARQCRAVYEASVAGRTGGGLAFQQNHYWFAHLSMALGAAAICGEVPEAEQWLAWAWDRFERIALSFSPDGGFHEGPGYWDYSMPTLYLYTDLYEWCTGLRIPAGDDGLAGQAQFRLHHVYPGLKLSAALEDSTVSISRPPTKLLLWEAKRFKDPVAMGMAALLNRGASSDRFNLLWLDESLPSRDPREALPLAKYYPDVETVFARTAWDDGATYVAFVSRPLGGHKWAELCSRFSLGGTGHNHPEQNHFILFGRGEVLAGDPGYTYEKRTRNHNTILVDGKGQYGDGQMWPGPTPGRAHITDFVTDGDIAMVIGDAASAYPEELGLTRFERTLVLAGRDLVVVCDRLAAKEPRTFSWLLHHWGKLSGGGGRWTVTRGTAQLGIAPLLPDRVEFEHSTYRPQFVHPTRDHTPQEPDVNLVELKAGPTKQTTFLVPLLVGGAGDALPDVRPASTDTCDAVELSGAVVAFNRGQSRMTVRAPWGETLQTDAKALVARMSEGKRQLVTLRASNPSAG